MKLRRIAYTSQSLEQFSKRDLLNLLHDARAFNKIDNITGVLMHRKGNFLQVFEGESETVGDLLTRILNDPRHNKIKIMLDASVDRRLFSNWAMGCADFDKPELSLIPGIRTDLRDPKVIKDIIIHLPEIADFLLKNVD
ncbi:MAG: hypothetical protein ACI8RP_000076 [Urechidicola sp.]|jgi:hypothetical protein|uniref:BLUF domain-containing protein n=1 Tax=Patiriisocius sp. Uisw_047 TaxID=3230969 RepID=UPI0039E9F4E4